MSAFSEAAQWAPWTNWVGIACFTGTPAGTRQRTAGVIFKIGIEIIETQRTDEAAAAGIDRAQSLFTDREASYCEGKRRRSEHYAARFAAKRAALKALGAERREDIELREVEVIDDEQGKPEMLLHGRVKGLLEQQQIKQVALTLAHCRDSAIAVVILQG
jgi:holo-[acyl-carrier protein] synthase